MIGEVCALAVVAAFSFFILSELKWRGAPILAILCFVGLLSIACTYAEELSGVLGALAEASEINRTVSSVLKIVGVGYLAGISSDICCELGVPRVGSAVSVIGRLEIIAIAAPFFMEMINMGTELIR